MERTTRNSMESCCRFVDRMSILTLLVVMVDVTDAFVMVNHLPNGHDGAAAAAGCGGSASRRTFVQATSGGLFGLPLWDGKSENANAGIGYTEEICLEANQ